MTILLYQLISSNPPNPALLRVIEHMLVAFFVALITWLFTRNKNKSDIGKTDSDTVRNYIEIITDLQEDIDNWISKVKELRVDAIKMEEVRYELVQAVEDVKSAERDKLAQLRSIWKKEREHLYESISKTLTIVKSIERESYLYPEYAMLRRETIRIVEMLTYIKGKLDPDRPDASIHITE